MKKPAIIIAALIISTGIRAQDTFSITAVDTLTGEVGSAGASCIGAPQIPQGCYILSDVKPGIGVIHTQAYYLAGNQNYASSLMNMGVAPEDMIDSLVAHDVQNNPTIRQYGIVDFYTGTPRMAAYTGVNCDDYKNHITGANYTIQGNILLGQQILDSMEARFLSTEGELACKLMAALQGAKVIGADTRCLDDGVSSLSTFLRVAKPDDPANDLYLDLNIPSVPAGIDPIDSLQALVDAWGGCYISGMASRTEEQRLSVFPNPSGGQITLQIHGPELNNATLVLINDQGQVVMEKSGLEGNEIVVGQFLPPGIYIYRLNEQNARAASGKILIQ